MILNLRRNKVIGTDTENLPPSSQNTQQMSNHGTENAATSNVAAGRRSSLSGSAVARAKAQAIKAKKKSPLAENMPLFQLEEDACTQEADVPMPHTAEDQPGKIDQRSRAEDEEGSSMAMCETTEDEVEARPKEQDGSVSDVDVLEVPQPGVQQETPSSKSSKSVAKVPRGCRSKRYAANKPKDCPEDDAVNLQESRKPDSLCSVAMFDLPPCRNEVNTDGCEHEVTNQLQEASVSEAKIQTEEDRKSVEAIVSELVRAVEAQETAAGDHAVEQSAPSALQVSDDEEATESVPRRRRASSIGVNYAEPNLNKKLRQVTNSLDDSCCSEVMFLQDYASHFLQ